MAMLVGLRFLPTDEEILRHLENKRLDPDYSVHTITEAKIYQYEPVELLALPPIQADENWCNFFCEPDYINADRSRVHRKTNAGYWKPTGNPREINPKCSSEVSGMKRILLYYECGHGSKDIKTDWVMHQFSINDNSLYKRDFVVCRIRRNRNKKTRRFSTNVKGQQPKKLRTSTIDEENILPTSQLLPRNYPSSRNYISKDTYQEMQLVTELLPSNYLISNSRNHVEEDTSSKSQLLPSNNMISRVTEYTPLVSQVLSELIPSDNMISNSRNHVIENSSPEPQSMRPSLPINNSISNSRNHITENIYTESQLVTQSLPSNNSISNSRNHVAENNYPESQLVTQSLTSNNSISNSRNHVAENISMLLQILPSNNSISDSRNHVAENIFPELQLVTQSLTSNNSISNSRNHVAENISMLLQILPSNNSISNSRNHVAENTCPESQLVTQSLPSNKLISNSRNHITENISPESQLLSPESQLLLQLLPSNNSISNPRNHAEEIASPKLQLLQLLLQLLSQLLSSNNLVSDFINSPELQLLLSNQLISNKNHVAENTLHPMIFDTVNGCNGLDQPSFSAMQSPINPDQGSSYIQPSFSAMQSPINPDQGSSYCSVSSNGFNVLNSALGSEQEGGVVNPQAAVCDECPSEGTGNYTLPPDFSPSKRVEECCGGDSSDIDSKSFNEWVNDIFMYDTPCVNYN